MAAFEPFEPIRSRSMLKKTCPRGFRGIPGQAVHHFGVSGVLPRVIRLRVRDLA
jgi:hypothetical protein